MALVTFPVTSKESAAEAIAGDATASTTSLTMTLGNESAGVDLVVRDSEGTFASSSASELAAFGIITNNYTGYTLSIAGSDNNGLLTNTDTTITTNNTLSSIASATDTNTFNSSSSYNGKWGYLPSKYDSSDNTNFLPSPTTTASTLDVTDTANPTTANNYTIGLGARVDYTKPAGTYSNTFILTAVGNPITYSISYDKGNTADTVTNLPATQSSSTSETTIALSETVPVRANYDFLGWCNGIITTDEDEVDTCSGTVYNPNGDGTNLTFGIDQTTANIVTLHAMWQKVSSMQAWTGCSNLSSGDKIALTDARDGQEYDVTKIGDYCIMTENLAIGTTSNGTIPAEGSNFTGSDITPDYTEYTYFTSSYATNKVIQADSNYGAYYNYCLASAGTICSNTQTDATSDICPANWKMLTKTIWDTLRTTTSAASLFSAQLGGYRTDSASPSSTSYGYYWSSTAYSTSYPYYLYGTASSLNTSTYGRYRYNGLAIRCVYNPSVTVTVNRGTGISNVNINGGASGSSATYTGHMEDQITINATSTSGYGPSYTWAKTGGGTITNSTNTESNTFTLGPSNTNISVSATSGVAVIIKTATGVSSVSLNGTSCTSSSGCYITGLNPGSSYTLTATAATGYTFSSWTKTAGSITSSTSTSTTFTLPSTNSGTVATITPSATINYYTITFKTSNASGVVFNGTTYTNNQTASFPYGSTYSIAGKYSSRYGFSSWAATAGAFRDSTAEVTTYTVSNTATITLTGKSTSTAIQDLPISSCTTTPLLVYDTRDNQAYTVRKIGDSCYMVKNLAIGCSGDTASSISLTSSNSNISATWSTPTTSLTSSASYDNPEMTCSSTYGAWYNYAAASAGTITGSSNNTNALYDICPKGWRLPTQTEFTTLKNLSNSTSLFMPTLGGVYVNSALAYTDGGNWWSATTRSSYNRHYIYYNGTNNTFRISGGSNDHRSDGHYVRCIRETRTITEISNMQDINPTIVRNTTDNTTATLTDSRDNQVYTVAKINGSVWMTRNLAIGCNGTGSSYGSDVSSKSLSSSASNVSATWSTPTNGLNLGGSYTEPRMTCDTTYGAWYNYAAASAGTIIGDSNSNNDVYNICPSGWTLPTSTQHTNVRSYTSAFNPVYGGGWYNTTYIVDSNKYGYWWSSTSYSSTKRYRLNYNNGSLSTGGSSDYFLRNFGFYVRCVGME